jgi:hypothetical protein
MDCYNRKTHLQLYQVVLKGDDAFFELPGAQNFYLELEDVITLHFLETTDAKYDAVAMLMDQGLAFHTTVSGQVCIFAFPR